MVGDALAGRARHAPQQVRAKRDIGDTGRPEEREVDTQAADIAAKAQAVGAGAPEPYSRRGRGENFTQREIDLVRTRVMHFAIAQEVARCMREYQQKGTLDTPNLTGVSHVWFPEPNVNVYELRRGNPPADVKEDRPEHLRRKELVLDFDAIEPGHWVKAVDRLKTLMMSKYKREVPWIDAVIEAGSKIELPKA